MLKRIIIVITLALLFPSSVSAATYYVSENGNNTNSGTSTNQALKTIQAGVNKLSNGDTLVIMRGEYLESVRVVNKPNITITSQGDVKVFGIVPELYSTNAGWEKISNGYCYNYNFAQNYPTGEDNAWTKGNILLAYANDKQIYTYSNKTSFDKRHTDTRDSEGAYYDKSKICIYLENNQNPNNVGLKVGNGGPTFYISNSNNVKIKSGANSNFTIGYGGFRGGIYILGSNNVTVDGVNIINSFNGVYSLNSDNPTVTNSTFKQTFDPNWSWNDVKANANGGENSMETRAINLLAPASGINIVNNITITNNIIDGYFDGMRARVNTNQNNQGMVVAGNVIHNTYDDAFELDSNETDLGKIQIYHNLFYDIFNGISTVPLDKNDNTYIFENVIASTKKIRYTNSKQTSGSYGPNTFRYGKPGKFYGNPNRNLPSKNVKLYYNTLYAVGEENNSAPIQNGANGTEIEAIKNYDFIGNIIYSKGVLTYRTGELSDEVYFKCNIFFSENFSSNTYQRWNTYGAGTYAHLPNTPNAWTGNIEQNPQFTSLNGILTDPEQVLLKNDSPAIFANNNLTKNTCTVPASWPFASQINSSSSIGALDFENPFINDTNSPTPTTTIQEPIPTPSHCEDERSEDVAI